MESNLLILLNLLICTMSFTNTNNWNKSFDLSCMQVSHAKCFSSKVMVKDVFLQNGGQQSINCVSIHRTVTEIEPL